MTIQGNTDNSVKEGSVAYLDVTFLGKDGNEITITPNSVSYEIWCLTNNQEVKASTNITPGTSVEITLSSTDNQLINQENLYEERLVTITADIGGGNSIVDDFRYQVVNLKKRP